MGLEFPSVRTIDIDLTRIEQVQAKMPILQHRRCDLYRLISPINMIGMKQIFLFVFRIETLFSANR